MKDANDYRTYMWLVELLIKEEPGRTPRKIAKTTGIERFHIEDAIYELVRQGRVKINMDSTLSWVDSTT